MPNICCNELTITGSVKNIQIFLDKVSVIDKETNEPEVSIFNTIMPMPEGIDDSKQCDWANDNWGTKWGDYDTALYMLSRENILLIYNTAWGPGLEFILGQLPNQFPELNFHLNYEELGMEFGGDVQITKGKLVRNSMYDVKLECDSDGNTIEDENGEWVKIKSNRECI